MKKIISLQEALQDYKEAKKQPWFTGTPCFNRATGAVYVYHASTGSSFFCPNSSFTLEWVCRTAFGKDTLADAITAEQAEAAIKAVFPEFNNGLVAERSYPAPVDILRFLADNNLDIIDDSKDTRPHLVKLQNSTGVSVYLSPDNNQNIFFPGGVMLRSEDILKEFFGYHDPEEWYYAIRPYGKRTAEALANAEAALGFLEESDSYPIFSVSEYVHPESCTAELDGERVTVSFGLSDGGKWCFTYRTALEMQLSENLFHTFFFSKPLDLWLLKDFIELHSFARRMYSGSAREYYDFGTGKEKKRIHWLDFPSDDLLTKARASVYYQ